MGLTETTSWDGGRGDCWIHWGWRGPLKSFLLSPHLQHAASAPRDPYPPRPETRRRCLPATRHPRTAHGGSTEPNSLAGYDWQNDKPMRRQDVALGGPSLPDTVRIFSACYDGERAVRFHLRSFSADWWFFPLTSLLYWHWRRVSWSVHPKINPPYFL